MTLQSFPGLNHDQWNAYYHMCCQLMTYGDSYAGVQEVARTLRATSNSR